MADTSYRPGLNPLSSIYRYIVLLSIDIAHTLTHLHTYLKQFGYLNRSKAHHKVDFEQTEMPLDGIDS